MLADLASLSNPVADPSSAVKLYKKNKKLASRAKSVGNVLSGRDVSSVLPTKINKIPARLMYSLRPICLNKWSGLR